MTTPTCVFCHSKAMAYLCTKIRRQWCNNRPCRPCNAGAVWIGCGGLVQWQPWWL